MYNIFLSTFKHKWHIYKIIHLHIETKCLYLSIYQVMYVLFNYYIINYIYLIIYLKYFLCFPHARRPWWTPKLLLMPVAIAILKHVQSYTYAV